MPGRVPGHDCNPLCAGDEHSDVQWAEFGDEWMRDEIVRDWNDHPIVQSGLVVLVDVRRVEAGPPTPEQSARRAKVGRPREFWSGCYAWGVRWRELPL